MRFIASTYNYLIYLAVWLSNIEKTKHAKMPYLFGLIYSI